MKMIVMILTNQRQNMRKENRKQLNDTNSRKIERGRRRDMGVGDRQTDRHRQKDRDKLHEPMKRTK